MMVLRLNRCHNIVKSVIYKIVKIVNVLSSLWNQRVTVTKHEPCHEKTGFLPI